MPLVDITYLRGYRLMRLDANSCGIDQTREAIFFYLGRAVPGLLVKHKEELGLDDDTSEKGMQVCMHEYGAYDINTSNIWIKIQLSEEVSNPLERIKIRDRMFNILCQWFIDTGYYVPYDFALDIIWGPTSGCIHTADQNYSW